MSISELLDTWQKAQSIIENRIGHSTYMTWFSSVRTKTETPNAIVLEVPDEFFKKWMEEHYGQIIRDALTGVSTDTIQLSFVINPDIAKDAQEAQSHASIQEVKRPPVRTSPLNPRFSFDSFVVGPSNRFAHAACLAVVDSPAKAYNPLFLYGKVGLGKTHLMQAIVHKIHEKNPSKKSCYITSERFTNELINAIQHHSTEKFRRKYREIDLLLIDDIQFIAGKEATQEEFFNTFNTLYDNHKQIIVSSDRPPKEIQHMEERLVSRFAWGLITDIQPPDYETRVAILRKKIEREPVKVPGEVIEFIAQRIQTNIRELEGALIRVVAYSLLEEKEISLPLAEEVLKDLVRETRINISVDAIQRRVADCFNISVSDIRAKRRNKNIVLPRQVAMYLARELTNLSLPEIGESFGGKDHTTILHAWNKIKTCVTTDKGLKTTIHRIISEFKH
ncbi:chromosomal replication initiator protein DnaA [Candidatus Omnitrophota bacterium]